MGGGTDAHLFTPDRRAYLDKVAPGWDVDREAAWYSTADQVGAFHATHGRWPSQMATDPVEGSLGRWLTKHRVQAGGGQGAHLLTPDRQAYLDKVAPGWDVDRDEVWRSTADQVGAFHGTHGRWPSAKASDPVEKRLGVWLARQRVQVGGGTDAHLFAAGRRAYLDKVAPGWDESQQVVWDVSADRVVAFHGTHGRWPSAKASDPVEKRLGEWLARQRVRARGSRGAHLFTADHRAYLDKVAPGWLLEADGEQVAA